MCECTPRRMKMGSPIDEMRQRMVDPLAPFIHWEMIFKRVGCIPVHTTIDEGLGAPASNEPCLQEQGSRLEACAPRVFSREVSV